MLLQNTTAILLQNATEIYHKMCKFFYYKIRRFYYTMRQLLNMRCLLQIATVHKQQKKTNAKNYRYYERTFFNTINKKLTNNT